jgi:thioredoxin reductase (NADPH)
MITAETLAAIPLFATVPHRERETIASHAADIELQAGEWLVHEGETASFFALLSGRLSVIKRVGDVERSINAYKPGDTFGEVPLLLNSSFLAGMRAVDPSRVARLDSTDFRRLISSCAMFRDQVVRQMAERISGLQKIGVGAPPLAVKIIGHHYDSAFHSACGFLTRNQIAFTVLDPDDPNPAIETPPGLNDGKYPILIFADGSRLVAPSSRNIAERLGLQTQAEGDQPYDVVIVGAGPAGLAAGVYGASEGLRTLLIEREAPGGQAGSSSRIENYLGFPAGLSGDELSNRAWQQAKRLGAQMLSARSVVAVEPSGADGPHHVVLDGGERVAARALVLSTGVSWRKLDALGIAEFTGRGVYYGAARSEAFETRGKDVFLIGGGNSAGQAAMFFADYARRVSLLVRGSSLSTNMSKYLIDELSTKSNVIVELDSEVVSVRGKEHLEAIVVKNTRTNELRTYGTNSLFILIDADVESEALPSAIVRDALGYVCTGRDILDLEHYKHEYWPLKRDPYLLETSVPGVFAAGDMRHGSIKRVASSVGEGSMSIAFVHQYLSERVKTPL